jgi:hypothetical protein
MACTAVGTFDTSHSSGKALAEHWNGKRWSIQLPPNPPRSYLHSGVLSGVSCASASSCTAGGGYSSPSLSGQTLAEHWDGKRWSIQRTVNPLGDRGGGTEAGATWQFLAKVSCVSKSLCIAIGGESTSGGSESRQVLAERWNGKRWSLQQTPSSAGVSKPDLAGLSCLFGSFCVGAGGYTSANKNQQLAELWDGRTWSMEFPPAPPDASSILESVSCVSVKSCIAVGGFTPGGSNIFQTLAENYS